VIETHFVNQLLENQRIVGIQIDAPFPIVEADRARDHLRDVAVERAPDLAVLERGDFVFDETTLVDRPEERVLVCIISDGHENASQIYSYADIAARITALTATERWTFTYLGSNQDLATVAAQTGIAEGNMRSYDSTGEGTRSAWTEHATASTRRFRRQSAGTLHSTDFYAEDDASEVKTGPTKLV